MLAIFILANQTHSKAYVLIACIFGFLAAGGSLAISGTLCYLMLVLTVYYSISNKKIDVINIAMFMAAFIGSLINTLSPGNFIRQGVENGINTNILQVLDYTRGVYFVYLGRLFSYNNYAAVLAILLICGIALADKVNIHKIAWVVSSVLSIVAPAVSIFPVVFGYKTGWIPNRCVYILVVTIALCFGNLAVLIGTFIGKLPASAKHAVATIALILAIVVSVLSDCGPISYKTVRIAKGLYDHMYQDSFNNTKDMSENFSSHQGEDVEIYVPYKPEDIEDYYCFFLSEDADDLMNKAVAWAYNLKSIRNVGE
jgi:hypothetical protein